MPGVLTRLSNRGSAKAAVDIVDLHPSACSPDALCAAAHLRPLMTVDSRPLRFMGLELAELS